MKRKVVNLKNISSTSSTNVLSTKRERINATLKKDEINLELKMLPYEEINLDIVDRVSDVLQKHCRPNKFPRLSGLLSKKQTSGFTYNEDNIKLVIKDFFSDTTKH